MWIVGTSVLSLKGEFVASSGNTTKFVNPWRTPCIRVEEERFQTSNETGTKGNKERLANPHGLYIDTNGDVLVADCCNNRLSVFSKLFKFKSYIRIGQLYY